MRTKVRAAGQPVRESTSVRMYLRMTLTAPLRPARSCKCTACQATTRRCAPSCPRQPTPRWAWGWCCASCLTGLRPCTNLHFSKGSSERCQAHAYGSMAVDVGSPAFTIPLGCVPAPPAGHHWIARLHHPPVGPAHSQGERLPVAALFACPDPCTTHLMRWAPAKKLLQPASHPPT